jgi:hypothetical protein
MLRTVACSPFRRRPESLRRLGVAALPTADIVRVSSI